MSDRFAPPLRLATEHGVVHRDEAAFCGWPFVCGFWRTAGGDMIVAFKKKPTDYGNPAAVNHDEVSKARPLIVTVRSTDAGATWGGPETLFDLTMGPEAVAALGGWGHLPPVDFTDPDTLIASGATPDYYRVDSRAWVRVSTDAGQTWRHPVLMEMSGLPSVSGHASALVREDGVALIFATVALDGSWMRRTAVFRATEGGARWAFLSFVTPEADDGAAWTDRSLPVRFSPHRHFYPRAILLPSGRILCSMRGQRDPTSVLWTEVFASDDGGGSWRFLSRVNDWGAPGDLLRLADGRVVCVYGWRMPPYGIRARVSEDEGRTWGRELIVRDDGGSWDLGYPRVTETAPGEVLALYYFNRADDPVQQDGGVRHIAMSRFRL